MKEEKDVLNVATMDEGHNEELQKCKEKHDKNKKKNKKFNKLEFRKRLSNYLVTFVSIFTSMVVSYVSVSLFVFDQFNIHFYYLILIAVVAAIESLLVELFVRINNISLFIQIAVIYATCALSSLALAFTIDANIFSNPMFWIVSLPGSFIGLIVLSLIVYISKRREENQLNASLKRYKGNKNKKNKSFKIFTFLIIFVLTSFLMFNSSVCKAEPTKQDFSGFSFVVVPNFDITDESSWTVTITWETKEQIKYLEVKMHLEDGHEELVYDSDRANIATKKEEFVNNIYRYTLNFEINSNANLQCIELDFTYSYDEIPNENQKITKTYLLSTGYTKPKGLSAWSCLLIGIIVSIGTGASTFIIIQNTKKDFIKVKDDLEDDDNELQE